MLCMPGVKPLVCCGCPWSLDLSKMKNVFVVQHAYETSWGEEEAKFIGVFTSRTAAEEAVQSLKVQPGFRDFPDHFHISEYELDVRHWEDGFITENQPPVWSVWRHDDNGNTFLVSSNHTEGEALRIVREYEAKGHKQSYWAREGKLA